LLILKDETDAWLPVAVIEKEPSAGGVVSASDASNVAKPGFHAISFDFSAPTARPTHRYAPKLERATGTAEPDRQGVALMASQDIGDAIRPVFFQTEHEEFLYATHGGTLFLVDFRGRVYGVTCGHVFQDFEHRTLFITDERQAQKGSKPAPIKGLAYPSSLTGGAVGADISDLCVIEFDDDISSGVFKRSPYVIDETTIASAGEGHALQVCGVLKEKTLIDPPDIVIGYCRLDFTDIGFTTRDPTLRQGKAEFLNPEFESVTGISGSPVFDQTAHALCGMVVRGGMVGNSCTIYYIDIADIHHLLQAVSDHASHVSYTKHFLVAQRFPAARGSR
jgi:hypothetical protein